MCVCGFTCIRLRLLLIFFSLLLQSAFISGENSLESFLLEKKLVSRYPFLNDFIKEKCPLSSVGIDGNIDEFLICAETAKKVHESFSLVRYYQKALILDRKIGAILGDPNWKDEIIIEGNSFGYNRKEKLMYELANDERVKTICEIGFNSGYSALNFLSSNPTATVISFDDFHHSYSPAASIALSEIFPGRKLITIAGDSRFSIPQFYHLMKQQRDELKQQHNITSTPTELAGNIPLCNLIFIDGGHSSDVFLSDFHNMKYLADPAFHRVLIDDYDMSQVSDSYDELEAHGELINTVVARDIVKFDYIKWEANLVDNSVNFTYGYNTPNDQLHHAAVVMCNYVY
jgi:hypothetical protein